MQSYLVPALALAASGAFASPSVHRQRMLETRNIVNDASDAYDFVVVGGGLAGLVLGGRLSEDEGHSVLVLEAGGDGSDWADQISTKLEDAL